MSERRALVVGATGLTGRNTAEHLAATGVPPGRLSGRYWVSWVVVTAGIAVEFCLALWSAVEYYQTFAAVLGGRTSGPADGEGVSDEEMRPTRAE